MSAYNKLKKSVTGFNEFSTAKKLLLSLQTAFPNVTKAFTAFSTELSSGGSVLSAFKAGISALNPVTLALTAAVIAAGAAIAVMYNEAQKYSKALTAAEEAITAYESEQSELDSLQEEYNECMTLTGDQTDTIWHTVSGGSFSTWRS
ncbi:MAG: hypothetical protein LUE21_10670 [Oscillospiraceae bacterium]|nr:hypothetical protein [Oscillospiraceae bacterium]